MLSVNLIPGPPFLFLSQQKEEMKRGSGNAYHWAYLSVKSTYTMTAATELSLQNDVKVLKDYLKNLKK